MREVSSPIYQAVKVEGPSFPTGRAINFTKVTCGAGFCGDPKKTRFCCCFEGFHDFSFPDKVAKKFHIDRNQLQGPTMIDCYFRSQIHSIKNHCYWTLWINMRLRSFMTLPTFMILMRVFEYFAYAWLLHQCGFPGAGKYRLANYLLGGNPAPRHCNLTMYIYIYAYGQYASSHP